MRIRSVALAAGTAAVTCLIVMPGVPAADQAALIQDFMRVSGLGAQADRVTQQMQAQLEARRDEVDAKALDRVQGAMTRAFSPDQVRSRMAGSLKHADATQLRRAIEWLQQPLSSRMTELELAASDPAAEPALREYMGRLEHTPPSPARVDLIKRLSAAMGASETAMKVIAAMVDGLAQSLDAARGGESSAQQEAEAAMARMEDQRDLIEQGILLKLFFTYREASDDELAAYTGFWESELGHWLNEVVVNACIATLRGGAEDMAQQLAPRAKAE